MSSTPPEAALTPQAWCRRILRSLGQQPVDGREAGYFHMLLTYFIELDPSIDAFDSLLERYCADSRPGIAEAAMLLRSAWQRGRTVSAEAVAMPPLREVLRTLGALLDQAQARGAYITVDDHRAQLHPFGGAPITLGPREVQQEIAARVALRDQVAPTESIAPERFEVILRAVGHALDEMPAQAFELVATRRSVVIDGSAGVHQTYTLAQLDSLIAAALPAKSEPSPD